MLARDQLAAWLGQVHADGELSAHTFKLAFRLTHVADAVGFVRNAAVAKLGRDFSDAGEPIADTLGRLIARGYLQAVRNGPKIKGFRLVARAIKLRRQTTAHLIPFPSNRRRAFVEKQAQTMAKMSAEKGDAYLRFAASNPGRFDAAEGDRRSGDRAGVARSAKRNTGRAFPPRAAEQSAGARMTIAARDKQRVLDRLFKLRIRGLNIAVLRAILGYINPEHGVAWAKYCHYAEKSGRSERVVQRTVQVACDYLIFSLPVRGTDQFATATPRAGTIVCFQAVAAKQWLRLDVGRDANDPIPTFRHRVII